MLTPLLQSVQIGADSTAAQTPEVVNTSVLDLALAGGWWMLPLVVLFVIGTFVFFERYLQIRRSSRLPEGFLAQIQGHVRNGDIRAAQTLCESHHSPYAHLLLKGIQRLGSPLPDIRASIENEGNLEVQRLEKRVSTLATIAGAAPMLGFLGTVTGMIQAFMKIAHYEGNVNPSVLADGIYTAMITTAGGLIVGIPAYVGYNVLTNMINGVIFKLESTTTSFIDLLQEPAR